MKKAETFIEVMKPFYAMTVAVCAEKNSTVNLIPVLKQKILDNCTLNNGDSAFAKGLKKAIATNLEKRYEDADVHLCLQKAMSLHPRTKAKSIIDNDTWEVLTDEIVVLRVLFLLMF